MTFHNNPSPCRAQVPALEDGVRPAPDGESCSDPPAAGEAARYDRQIRFAPIGSDGQARLKGSTATVVGCGALGSVVVEILARAGVGRLQVIDRDTVEWSNLQRQSLFDEADARCGRAKAEAAAVRIGQINSDVEVVPHVVDLTTDNARSLLEAADVIVDGTDNFATRFLINDVSLELSVPWVHGGCVGGGGQVAVFSGQGNPCFRCLTPQPPDPTSVATCDTAGVIGAATHAVASLQAIEALKVLSGNAAAVRRDVLVLDLWGSRIRSLELDVPPCVACTEGRRDFLHGDAAAAGDRPVVLCGRGAVQLPAMAGRRVDLQRIGARWNTLGKVDLHPFLVRLHLEHGRSVTLFGDGRAVIGGTEDPAIARTLYARYVGG